MALILIRFLCYDLSNPWISEGPLPFRPLSGLPPLFGHLRIMAIFVFRGSSDYILLNRFRMIFNIPPLIYVTTHNLTTIIVALLARELLI